VARLERQLATLALSVNHVRGGASVTDPYSCAVDEVSLPVICLDGPFQALTGDGDNATIETGPVFLTWNETEKRWEGSNGGLYAKKELKDLPGVSDSDVDPVAGATVVTDMVASDLRCYLSNVLVPTNAGLAINGDAWVITGSDDRDTPPLTMGQMVFVHKTFTEAPFPDGKKDLAFAVGYYL
jgi:hypothetical protein